MRMFYSFKKRYVHTVIRDLQGLNTILCIYIKVTFTTFVKVLADDKDTTWKRHGYIFKVTGVHEENR